MPPSSSTAAPRDAGSRAAGRGARHGSRRALALALALVAGGVRVAPAQAAKPVVALVPFGGPQASRAEAEVLRVLRKRARFIAPAVWEASARKLFATTNSAQDVAAVAQDLGVRLVITGAVHRDGRRWLLSVNLRDGATGRSAEKLKYPLPGPSVPNQALARLAVDLPEAFERALAAEPAVPVEAPPAAEPAPVAEPEPRPTPPPKRPRREPKVVTVDESADTAARAGAGDVGATGSEAPAPAPVVTRAAPAKARPSWAPYIDGMAGMSITGRNFTFDPTSPTTNPGFSSKVTLGLRVDLTVYPLAFLHDVAHGVFSGLGAGVTLDKPFWLDSMPQPTSANPNPTARYPTSELRIEGGLRWRIVLYKPLPRPQLYVMVGGGLHNFAIGKKPDGSDAGPPDVSYKYVTIGGGARVNIIERLSLWALFNGHFITNAGPVIDPATEYGDLSSTSALRVQGGLDFVIVKGFKAGVLGFYERIKLTFLNDMNAPPFKSASTATDEYYGGYVVAGYQY